ncbi:MAG: ABC transporter ATP-binding protein [Rhodospirillales bacterium]|nr:ABC transporter ATP-binding protein [Rhodospirillales bacterium]
MRKVIDIFLKARGGRPGLVLICLMCAGLAGGFSIVGLLPMLALATGDLEKQSSGAAHSIVGALNSVGLDATFGTLMLIFLASITLKAVLVMLAMRIVGKASAEVANNLRIDLITSLLDVRWRFFTSQPIGRIANAFSAEAGGCAMAYLIAANFFSAAIQSLIYVTAALFVSWRLTLVAVVFGGLTSLILASFVQLTRRAAASRSASTRRWPSISSTA